MEGIVTAHNLDRNRDGEVMVLPSNSNLSAHDYFLYEKNMRRKKYRDCGLLLSKLRWLVFVSVREHIHGGVVKWLWKEIRNQRIKEEKWKVSGEDEVIVGERDCSGESSCLKKRRTIRGGQKYEIQSSGGRKVSSLGKSDVSGDEDMKDSSIKKMSSGEFSVESDDKKMDSSAWRRNLKESSSGETESVDKGVSRKSIEYQSLMCHQCQRNDKGAVVFCSKCNRKRYCYPCLSNWYPDKTREEIEKACPVCRGYCNCKACLRADILMYSRQEPDANVRLNRLRYLLHRVLPLLRQIQLEQNYEIEMEAKIQEERKQAKEGMPKRCRT